MYSFTMHLFRDETIPEIETSDNEHHSESDNDYDEPFVRHERMAEDATISLGD